MEEDDVTLIHEEIRNACEALRGGGLILYPTDTVWSIGCDATCADAVRRVYELKRRADHRAMLVLLDSADRLETYVAKVPDAARELLAAATRPLTVIYPDARRVAPNLTGSDGSLGIRITNERFSHALCARFRKPLVSTSANVSGEPSPATFGDISETIRSGVDYVVRYRRDEKAAARRPSSIVRIDGEGIIQVIRE